MTLLEKILIGTILLAGLSTKFLGLFEMKSASLLLILTYFSIIGLIIYYVLKLKPSVYTVVLALMLVETIGLLFAIQHWPGQEILYFAGLLGTLMFSVLLFWAVINKENRINPLYFILIGSALLAQIVLIAFTDQRTAYYGQFINYLVVAIIATMKINKLQINTGTDKVLNVILIQGVLLILSHTLNMI
jgi:hypothetical protein